NAENEQPGDVVNAGALVNIQPSQISRVAIKPPPFWKNNPVLWFAQLESQFSISQISTDATKFHHVVAAIESDILNSVQDLVLNPPAANKYTALKNRLISIFSESEASKIRTLLQGLELGDQRPSYLLARMRELAESHLSENILKSLWLARLPQNIQAILAASNENLTQLAAMADKIIELASPIQINSVESVVTSANPTVYDQISELTKQINELKTSFQEAQQNRQGRERTNTYRGNRNHIRSRSRQNYYREPQNNMCFYHTNFGDRARKFKPLFPES
ncbi:uncharacterized protein, partial [Parasteatoda tepidariorum]|uniref:uncharacterized protein n=1 Tax=Parasteatoda tepidariorum TaxID=114398 RepID=UPI0039BC333C